MLWKHEYIVDRKRRGNYQAEGDEEDDVVEERVCDESRTPSMDWSQKMRQKRERERERERETENQKTKERERK